jgi:hypothetical protein
MELSSNGGVIEEIVGSKIVGAGRSASQPTSLIDGLNLILGLDIHNVLSPVGIFGSNRRWGVVAASNDIVDIDSVHRFGSLISVENTIGVQHGFGARGVEWLPPPLRNNCVFK